MCGRYLLHTPPEALRTFFGYSEQPNFPPRHNIAPTQPIPVVRLDGGARHFALVRWGLIPAWAKNPGDVPLLINARAETVATKPAFRNAIRRRRCLVPADGFYEWQRAGDRKRPMLIRPRNGGPIAFAGLWETWTGPNGEEMDTAAIATCPANRVLAPIHDRMPLVLDPAAWDLWLDAARVDVATVSALLVPARDDLLEAFEVGPRVNKVSNDDADLMTPVGAAAAPEPPRQGSLF